MAEENTVFLFTQLGLPVFSFSSFKNIHCTCRMKNSINCNLWEFSSLIPPEVSCCYHWWEDFVMHFKSKVHMKCLDKAVQMDCLVYKSAVAITNLPGYP